MVNVSLTVAAQHTLTSYLCPSFSPLSSTQEEAPSAASSVGKAASRWVRRAQRCGDSSGSCRSSSVGESTGTARASGPRSMTFSVFAMTEEAARASERKAKSIVARLTCVTWGPGGELRAVGITDVVQSVELGCGWYVVEGEALKPGDIYLHGYIVCRRCLPYVNSPGAWINPGSRGSLDQVNIPKAA